MIGLIAAIDVILETLSKLNTGSERIRALMDFIGEMAQEGPELWQQIKSCFENTSEPTLEDLIAARNELRPPVEPI